MANRIPPPPPPHPRLFTFMARRSPDIDCPHRIASDGRISCNAVWTSQSLVFTFFNIACVIPLYLNRVDSLKVSASRSGQRSVHWGQVKGQYIKVRSKVSASRSALYKVRSKVSTSRSGQRLVHQGQHYIRSGQRSVHRGQVKGQCIKVSII